MSESQAFYATPSDERAPVAGFFSAFIDGRKGQILDAALEVFGEKGYEAGTMRDIARRVGVSEPALYRHYDGKEALLLELVETAGTHLMSTAAQRLESAQAAGARDVLVSLMRDRRSLLNANTSLMRTLVLATHHNATARDVFRRTTLEPMMQTLTRVTGAMDAERGITRSAEETRAHVRTLVSLFVGHLLTSQILSESADDEALATAAMLLMGWSDET